MRYHPFLLEGEEGQWGEIQKAISRNAERVRGGLEMHVGELISLIVSTGLQ